MFFEIRGADGGNGEGAAGHEADERVFRPLRLHEMAALDRLSEPDAAALVVAIGLLRRCDLGLVAVFAEIEAVNRQPFRRRARRRRGTRSPGNAPRVPSTRASDGSERRCGRPPSR